MVRRQLASILVLREVSFLPVSVRFHVVLVTYCLKDAEEEASSVQTGRRFACCQQHGQCPPNKHTSTDPIESMKVKEMENAVSSVRKAWSAINNGDIFSCMILIELRFGFFSTPILHLSSYHFLGPTFFSYRLQNERKKKRRPLERCADSNPPSFLDIQCACCPHTSICDGTSAMMYLQH